MVIEEQAVTMCYISKEEENQEMTGFTSVHYNNCSIRIPKKNCSIRIYFILFYYFYKLRSFAISWLILLPHNKTKKKKKNLVPCKFVQDLGTWNVLCSGQVAHTNRSFNQISQFLSKKKRKKIQIGQLFTQNYFL